LTENIESIDITVKQLSKPVK